MPLTATRPFQLEREREEKKARAAQQRNQGGAVVTVDPLMEENVNHLMTDEDEGGFTAARGIDSAIIMTSKGERGRGKRGRSKGKGRRGR